MAWRPARGDLQAVTGKVDVVERFTFPDHQDHIDRFNERVVKAELVGQDDRLAALRLQGQHEHAEFMCLPLFSCRLKSAPKPLPCRCATA